MRAEEAQSPGPTHIGPYRILDTLGSGGMGTVYLVEQHAPIHRRVALKLIKLGMDSKSVVARFEQERQALALMQHDGIARVYDCGTSERGQPYFVMELVKGVPLTEFCDQRKLSLRDRLLLMRQVCVAIQHAHQKGVVHRDLKPGNVLVVDDGGEPQVKIIDFGLAKAMGQKLVEATLFTETGQVVGTPEYMAPEQADPTNADIDTRADIYSLGVMLYELLVGTLPFAPGELRRAGMLEVRRILREVDPPKPSAKLTSGGAVSADVARARRISVAALSRALKNDLDWVVLKALEKDRNRRYETASAMSADLQRFLDDEPLAAGPPSAGYRLKKLARRYRTQVLAGGAVLATAVIGGVVAVGFAMGLAEKVREFDQLKVNVLYERAVERESRLYPAWPDGGMVERMEAWLRDDCDPLLAMRPGIRRTVDDLRARAVRSGAGVAGGGAETTWTFADEAPRFLHDTLTGLLSDLDRLESEQRAAVVDRLAWARRVGALTQPRHKNARFGWDEARDAVARNEKYAGRTIELRPQDVRGLVPIGQNPVTGYWEFYHLRSAWDPHGGVAPEDVAIPVHEPDGSIRVTGDTGIVFVLLPGGTFTMGAQKEDPGGPNFDPQARTIEAPTFRTETRVIEVTLGPCFVARHELTKGQWKRLSGGDDPGAFRVGDVWSGESVPIGWAHPIDGVDWVASDRLLREHGLALPTEAQWEYACRAGTSTPWWPGGEAADLSGCANLLDRVAARTNAYWGVAEDDFEDGWVFPAPVGSFRANAFGLFDTHGNLREWCQDEFAGYDAAALRPGDGLRLHGSGAGDRVTRGAAFREPPIEARSAFRNREAPNVRNYRLGLRAARAVRWGD